MNCVTTKGFFAAALLGISGVAQAGLITIDDSGLAHGTDMVGAGPLATTGSSVTYTVSVASGPNAGTALVFDTGLSGTADPDLEAPFDDPATATDEALEPGKIVIIGNNNDNTDDDPDGGTVTFTFSKTISFLSFRFFDTGDSGADGIDIEVDGTMFSNLGAGLGDNEFSTFNLGGVSGGMSSFTLSGSGGFDNIMFTEVPTPGTLFLIGIAMLGLGFGVRRTPATGQD